MNLVTNCPCCSTPMLHHFRHRQEYWFCRRCWQEMPALSLKDDSWPQNRIINLSPNLIRRSKTLV
jgi:ribosomal protein L37AE/L43A